MNRRTRLSRFSYQPLSLSCAAALLAFAGDVGAQILTGRPGQLTGPSVPGYPTPLSSSDPNQVMGEARRFKYAFRLSLAATYDDNIFIARSNKTGDWVFTVEPSITFGVGDVFGQAGNFVRVDYQPGFSFFSENGDQNNVQHTFRASGRYTFNRLSLSFGQSIQVINGADTDVGTRVSRHVYQTTLGMNYAITGKTSVDLGFNYTVNSYKNQVDSDVIGGNLYFNWIYSPKWTFGLGGAVGVTRVDGPFSPDQTSEQINFRANYQATGKLAFNISFGVEFRQFDSARSTTTTPIFELGMVYQPFDGTTITLRGGRRTQNSSILVAQNFTTTSFGLTFRQRFIQRVFLTAGIQFENSDYSENVRGIISGRSDNYVTFNIGLDYSVREGLSLGAFYTHRENTGNTLSRPFEFSNNQYGVRATVSF